MSVKMLCSLSLFASVVSAVRIIQGTRLVLNSVDSDPAKTRATSDCTDWHQVEDTSFFGRSESAVYECRACSPGCALVKGPPNGFKDEFPKVGVTQHCSRMTGDPLKVLAIRHGQSVWNHVMESTYKVAGITGLSSVWKDSPLSDLGLRQAQRLAQILHKADVAVYGEESASWGDLSAAATELGYTDLEKFVPIVNKSVEPRSVVSDDQAVEALKTHREELDVLLGRKCEDTAVVSSQLIRAMDTLTIATMPARIRCKATWQISSNLQEIEHNADCDARTEPHHKPVVDAQQLEQYSQMQMTETVEYVKGSYASADVSRHNVNLGELERMRIFDQSSQMTKEVDHIFTAGKKYTIWGGHSIWFRQFFQTFGDLSDETCREFMQVKMANTGVISANFRRVEGSAQKYVATDCKWIHLGDSSKYKIQLDTRVLTTRVPVGADFVASPTNRIMGWKCCCSRADVEGPIDASKNWISKTIDAEQYMGKCLIVRTDACSRPAEWHEIANNAATAAKASNYKWHSTWGKLPVAGGCSAP